MNATVSPLEFPSNPCSSRQPHPARRLSPQPELNPQLSTASSTLTLKLVESLNLLHHNHHQAKAASGCCRTAEQVARPAFLPSGVHTQQVTRCIKPVTHHVREGWREHLSRGGLLARGAGGEGRGLSSAAVLRLPPFLSCCVTPMGLCCSFCTWACAVTDASDAKRTKRVSLPRGGEEGQSHLGVL